GRRAEVSWPDIAGGLLITGHDRAGVTSTGLDLATAAIQHRKAVIIIDLTDGTARRIGRQSRSAGHESRQVAVATAVALASKDADAPLVTANTAAGCHETAAAPGEVSLARALTRREVVLFSLDQELHRQAAVKVASLVLADLAGLLAHRAELGA